MERNVNQFEDEIDLKELIVKIIKNFKYIILITSLFVVAALIYVFLAKPVYESKALVEIGYIKRDGKIEYIENPDSLIKELNTLFADKIKYENKKSESYISQIKKLNINFIQITANGIDTEKASKEIEKVLSYIQKKHSNIINEYIDNVTFHLNSLDKEISLKNEQIAIIDQEMYSLKNTKVKNIEDKIYELKNIKLKGIEEKIETLKNVRLREIEEHINTLKNVKLKKIENDLTREKEKLSNEDLMKLELERNKLLNVDLAQLQIEKDQLLKVELPQLMIERDKILNIDIPQLERERDNLLILEFEKLKISKINLLEIELPRLEERKKLLQYSISKAGYQNTETVGNILSREHPIRPKKRLILAISFVTGFILSIFFIFFKDFVKEVYQEIKR